MAQEGIQQASNPSDSVQLDTSRHYGSAPLLLPGNGLSERIGNIGSVKMYPPQPRASAPGGPGSLDPMTSLPRKKLPMAFGGEVPLAHQLSRGYRIHMFETKLAQAKNSQPSVSKLSWASICLACDRRVQAVPFARTGMSFQELIIPSVHVTNPEPVALSEEKERTSTQGWSFGSRNLPSQNRLRQRHGTALSRPCRPQIVLRVARSEPCSARTWEIGHPLSLLLRDRWRRKLHSKRSALTQIQRTQHARCSFQAHGTLLPLQLGSLSAISQVDSRFRHAAVQPSSLAGARPTFVPCGHPTRHTLLRLVPTLAEQIGGALVKAQTLRNPDSLLFAAKQYRPRCNHDWPKPLAGTRLAQTGRMRG